MKWLVERIAGLLRACTDALLSRRTSRWHQEEIYESRGNKEEFFESLRAEGGGRTHTLQAIGPAASSDGIGWEEEDISYTDEDMVQTNVKYRLSRRCDCGSILSHDNMVLGTCSVCSRVLCRQEGCGARCERCGALVCRRHSQSFGEHMFCSGHRYHGLWLLFWGALK